MAKTTRKRTKQAAGPKLTPSERLKKAAGIIRKKGWVQGMFRARFAGGNQNGVPYKKGAVCAYQAYDEAGDGLDALKLLASRIYRVTAEVFPSLSAYHLAEDLRDYVISWNDAAGRTEAEVLAVLEGRRGR